MAYYKIIKNIESGFTLIETLVYVAMFVVLLSGIMAFLQTIAQSRINNQTILEVNDQGNLAIGLITQTLRNASSVNTPAISATSSMLSVNTTLASTTPTVFSQVSGVLYITEGSSTAVALTNNKISVSNLIFSNLARSGTPSLVQANFKLSSVANTTRAEYNYSANFFGSGELRK